MEEVCSQFLGSASAGLLSGHFFHSVIAAYPPWHPSLICFDWKQLVSLFAARPYLLSSCSAFVLSQIPWQISSVLQGVASLLLASLLKVPTDKEKEKNSFRNRLSIFPITDRQSYHSEEVVKVYRPAGSDTQIDNHIILVY